MRHTLLSFSNQSVLEKYGGIEHLEAPPRELIFSQTEDYVEYTRHGKIIKGEEDPKVRFIKFHIFSHGCMQGCVNFSSQRSHQSRSRCLAGKLVQLGLIHLFLN